MGKICIGWQMQAAQPGWVFQKIASLLVFGQERADLGANCGIQRARCGEEIFPLFAWQIQGACE